MHISQINTPSSISANPVADDNAPSDRRRDFAEKRGESAAERIDDGATDEHGGKIPLHAVEVGGGNARPLHQQQIGERIDQQPCGGKPPHSFAPYRDRKNNSERDQVTGKDAPDFFAQIAQRAVAKVHGGGRSGQLFPHALRQEDSREKKEKFHADGAVYAERDIEAAAVKTFIKKGFFNVKEKNIQTEKKAP